MFDLAQNLMIAAQKWQLERHTNVVGQRARLQKSPYRVGMWPIISETEPEIALGVGLVLGTLLELHPSVSVYRILARVEAEVDTYEWSLENSQFGVDDWEVEGLDENVAIWGSFESHDGRITFSVEVENDARDDDVTLKINRDNIHLTELLDLLPAVSMEIVKWLALSGSSIDSRYKLVTDKDNDSAHELLRCLFYWELDYFLELWGQPADQRSILSDFDELEGLAQDMESDFGAWILSYCMSRLIMFDENRWSSLLGERVKKTTEALVAFPVVPRVLSTTLYRLKLSLEAFDLLEMALAHHSKNAVLWNTLAAFYSESREDFAAVDVYQRAIEAEAATSNTYLGYANAMMLLSERQLELNSEGRHVSPAGRPFVDRYVFNETDEQWTCLREAVIAYRRAFELDSKNLDILTQLVNCLITLQEDDAWKYFLILVEQDNDGSVTASIIDQLQDKDLYKVIEIFNQWLVGSPSQIFVRINLVRAYLAVDETAKARSELLTITEQLVPTPLQSTISRLQLMVDIPDFDNRLGEINDILQAKGKVSAADLEFLENVIEHTPSFAEGYRLLAHAYLSWDERQDAVEVLLDGQNKAPFDADLIASLARVFWDEDEFDLAFTNIEKGLEHDSQNATLLALFGRFLFDEGQDEEAKEYLLRAEQIDPSNSELVSARLYVANTLIGNRKN
ncbi:MAG: hypothetical protein GC179_02780 [Anaerolineaceae bacterium]|nr:hypothetical protein [Anaerolineaceae bacterium]